MITFFYLFLFILCCFALYVSGELVVKGLIKISKFLSLKEFVVAFFIMAFAASLPNLFVGISSIMHNVPQLALGDIMGNSIVSLTLGMALSVFCLKGRVSVPSKMVQTTSLFTLAASVFPLILLLDSRLSRTDGLLLIAFFIIYVFWLFSKKERFAKVYSGEKHLPILKELKNFSKNISKVLLGIVILIIAAQGIVISAKFFALNFNLPIIFIGLLITGFASALPEVSFAIISAKKGENWLILGDLMGAVIIPATLVLGIVALIKPIQIFDFSSLFIAIGFLATSSIFFFFFVRTNRQITLKEAIFLLFLYFSFILTQILFR